MKKILSFCLAAALIIGFCIPAFASYHNPYDNINENTSQVNILINAMLNCTDFNPFEYWVCWRESQYDYRIAFNYDLSQSSDDVYIIRYYTDAPQNPWHLTVYQTEQDFSINTVSKSCVGNFITTIQSSTYRQYLTLFYLRLTLPFILIVLCFSIFKIRKGKYYGC